jgi:hypothetical protein
MCCNARTGCVRQADIFCWFRDGSADVVGRHELDRRSARAHHAIQPHPPGLGAPVVLAMPG